MADFILPPLRPASIDWQAETPYSVDYRDSYFMPGRGMDESTCVFITASDLARRFSALPDDGLFVIGETGFGTGLNALLAARCFALCAPASARLHFVSSELHPLEQHDLARALAAWPELTAFSQPLLDAWPPPAPGFHRIRLARQVELTLMFGDSAILWPAGPERIDAWFLDGFAPARNPGAWTDTLFRAIFARSRPGATVATFTAAGQVRRGLAAAGFEVERRPGFERKRHRLGARRPGAWTPQRRYRGAALVVGAGLAGCTTARALAERGWQVRVLDPAPAEAPPAPLAAVLYATASHCLNAPNRFYLGAMGHARQWLKRLAFPRAASDGRLDGIIQHLVSARLARKTGRALSSRTWPPQMLSRLSDTRVRIANAGCLNVHRWREFLLDHPGIALERERVAAIDPADAARVLTRSGKRLAGDALIMCTAGASTQFSSLRWLPLRTTRGQVTFCRATSASRRWVKTHCFSGYLTPAIDGVHCLGATFDRIRKQPIVDPADDEHNLATLRQELPELWRALGGPEIDVIGQHAGLRSQSPDSLPLVGPRPNPERNPHALNERVWLNIAHSARALTHTPLCADIIADRLSNQPVAADAAVVAALAPERLIERRRRRNPDWRPDPV